MPKHQISRRVAAAKARHFPHDPRAKGTPPGPCPPPGMPPPWQPSTKEQKDPSALFWDSARHGTYVAGATPPEAPPAE